MPGGTLPPSTLWGLSSYTESDFSHLTAHQVYFPTSTSGWAGCSRPSPVMVWAVSQGSEASILARPQGWGGGALSFLGMSWGCGGLAAWPRPQC